MKILYVTTISNTMNAFLIPHIKMLVEEGHEVDVAFNIVSKVSPEIFENGCKVYNVPFQRSPLSADNFKAYAALKKIIKDEKYDIVHTHTPVASVITRLVCKNLKSVKVFYTAHGFHFFKGAPLLNWIIYYPIEKWLSKYTDVLITINKADYDIAINKKFRSKKVIFVNGVGINLERFQPQKQSKKLLLREQYNYRSNHFILLYAGELSYRKHQDLLIRVAAKLKDKIPNLKILFAGIGDLKEQYTKQIDELGVHRQVEMLGYRKDIDNLMNIADVAVSASRQEGLPVNVMEAMATGLPLVVTNCRGNVDLVKDKENGYIVMIDDVDYFAESIEKLYKSKDLRAEFGKNSLELINKYSINNVIKEIESIYSHYI